MDEIVKQAMAKWPNVPHCYGWLALDARGGWRMRDERAQSLKLSGDRINNAALQGFINRNYTHDEQGRWYFQNGPQRVYINLEATPYIARTDPQHGYVLQTGAVLQEIEAAWLTETGQLVFKNGEVIAQLDDRDMAQCLTRLRLDQRPADDEALLAWLEQEGKTGLLTYEHGGRQINVQPIQNDSLSRTFGFDPAPSADEASS